MTLLNATRSEVAKQFSTATWWILGIVLVFYVGSSAGGIAALLGAQQEGLLGDVEALPVTGDVALLLYSFAASLGYVFALIIGALMVTTEFRHKTLTPTFLAVPRRGRVLAAKVLVGAVFGLLIGILALVAAVVPSAGLLALFGLDTGLGGGDAWALFGRTLIALVIWTILGIGVGALVRNQVVAVVGVLAFTQFLEPIVRMAVGFIPDAGRAADFLPGAASDALVGASFYSLAGVTAAEPLPWWGGGLVLAAYAVVFLILGALTSWRRDVV